ncbi:metal ion (Mn2+-iron) transporter, Nramp family [Galdieria sulphuraria]|uniref:Metal ion (Mn2+-iron) transporter, Nramp family n=1 Tax=Galdieria sulphuraria TaxID=130081 RepID=M2Y1S4_GALSU|nr:metal ion (Mn2+-iron) transporter, Nramp family [Galdieria sulphuraria]EME29873.1 metal ion (Mn2+-iron) transporter, Nramp family [Galdieria sulphuraria]|eukprot:XP_005706393.1 metal ion (Mn2+-iron) transporter, Nramp family [Galdieria sulphuraria]
MTAESTVIMTPGQVSVENDSACQLARDMRFMEGIYMDNKEKNNFVGKFRRFWKQICLWFLGLLKFAGPGWLVCIGLIDAGNYEGDIQAGAGFQYKLIWIIWWSAVVEVLVQILSIRLGLYSRLDLAQSCRKNYSRFVSYTLWILMEAAMIANDLTQVIGFATACEILFHLPLYAGVLLSFVTALLVLSLQYWSVRYLELCVTLIILAMCVTFFIQWSMVNTNGVELMRGWIIPSIPSDSSLVILSQIGSCIMPQSIFLQSSMVQTRKVESTKKALHRAYVYNVIEFLIPMLLVFVANLAAISLAAVGFYNNSQITVSYSDVSLSNTCQLLRTAYPENGAGCILFGLSLLASSQSAVVSGTFAGQIVIEGFFNIRMPLWLRNIVTRLVTIIPALMIAILAGNQGSGLALLISSSILSATVPFAIIPLLKFTQSSKIMGTFRNPRYVSVLMWCIAIGLVIINVYLIVGVQGNYTLQSSLSDISLASILGIIATIVVGIWYVAFLIFLIWYPVVFESTVHQVTI